MLTRDCELNNGNIVRMGALSPVFRDLGERAG